MREQTLCDLKLYALILLLKWARMKKTWRAWSKATWHYSEFKLHSWWPKLISQSQGVIRPDYKRIWDTCITFYKSSQPQITYNLAQIALKIEFANGHKNGSYMVYVYWDWVQWNPLLQTEDWVILVNMAMGLCTGS